MVLNNGKLTVPRSIRRSNKFTSINLEMYLCKRIGQLMSYSEDVWCIQFDWRLYLCWLQITDSNLLTQWLEHHSLDCLCGCIHWYIYLIIVWLSSHVYCPFYSQSKLILLSVHKARATFIKLKPLRPIAFIHLQINLLSLWQFVHIIMSNRSIQSADYMNLMANVRCLAFDDRSAIASFFFFFCWFMANFIFICLSIFCDCENTNSISLFLLKISSHIHH